MLIETIDQADQIKFDQPNNLFDTQHKSNKGLHMNDFDIDIVNAVFSKSSLDNNNNQSNKKLGSDWNLKKGFKQSNTHSQSKFYTLKQKIQLIKQKNSGIVATQYQKQKKQQKQNFDSFKGQAKQHYSFDSQKPPPTFSSPQFNLSKPLIKACRDLDYDQPTPIQIKAIPLISKPSSVNDLLATAATGSGKTACFLLPILQKLIKSYQSKKSSQKLIGKTRALILIPTRELAAQCDAMLEQLKKYVNFITSCLIIGGADMKRQEIELRSRPDIVIATTGRLLDHAVNSRAIDLSGIRYLVLDEADKLLQMDFKDQLKQVLKMCGSSSSNSNAKRQTLLFSATLSERVELLAEIALKNPVRINTYGGGKKNKQGGVPMLQQYIVRLRQKDAEETEVQVEDRKQQEDQGQSGDQQEFSQEEKEQGSQDDDDGEDDGDDDDDDDDDEDDDQQETSHKPKKSEQKKKKHINSPEQIADLYRKATLISLCKRNFTKRVIIFFNTRNECHTMLGIFTFLDLNAVELHGQLDQKQRLQAVTQFQKGKADFLLATDLVSRGIDIQNVNAVINFQFPKQVTRYTHRIGRTARAGNFGMALTICDEDERRLLKKMSRKSTSGQISTYSVPLKLVQSSKDKILSIQQKVQELIQGQKQEGQFKKAESQLLRAENMIEHKDQILSKPRKQWHKSVKDKKQLQKASKELLDQNFKKLFEQGNDFKRNNNSNKKGQSRQMLKRKMKQKLKKQIESDKATRQMKLVKKHHKKKLQNKNHHIEQKQQQQQQQQTTKKKKSLFDKQKS